MWAGILVLFTAYPILRYEWLKGKVDFSDLWFWTCLSFQVMFASALLLFHRCSLEFARKASPPVDPQLALERDGSQEPPHPLP